MLEKLPHKNLFYFGLIVVFVFIGLSYWQLTRYQQDKLIIDSKLGIYDHVFIMEKMDITLLVCMGQN